MTTQAVQDDIFSILRRFTSPRMGPYENTQAPTPVPPQPGTEQQQDLVGGGGTPALAGGPAADTLTPPVPVGRRVVPEGEAAAAVSTPVAGAPPAVSATNATAVGMPAGGDAPFLADSPYYKYWLAQQQQRVIEARKQQGMDNIIGGLGGIANATGGNVAIGEATRPGSDEKTGSKYLSIDQFRKFSEESAGMKAEAEAIRRIDEISRDPKMAGMSKTELLAIYKSNPAQFAKLIADYNDPTTETFTTHDGSVYSRRKNDPNSAAQPNLILRDPAKAAHESIIRAKGAQEIIDPALQSDETLRVIAKELNLSNPSDPAVIASLRRMSPAKLQDMRSSVLTEKTKISGSYAWENEEIKTAATDRAKLGTAIGNLPQIEYLVDQIDAGMRAPDSWAGDKVNTFYRELAWLTGNGEQGQRSNEAYQAAVQESVQSVLKIYGSQASNDDRKAAGMSFGADMSAEGARGQLALVAKSKIWDAQRHNANIDDRIANTNMSEGNKEALRAQKVTMPPPTPQTLHVMNIKPTEVEWLRSKIGTPQEKEARALFRQNYGQNIGEWALGELKS